MIDLYLKFTDAAQFMGVVGLSEIPEGGYFIGTFDGSHCDVCATFGTGIIDGVDGYHVNVRCMGDEIPATFAPYVIEPQNPVQGWA